MPRRPASPLPALALVGTLAACDGRPTAVVEREPAARGRDARAAASVTVVMSALENPRQLEFGPDGALYVAEAGRPTSSGACVPGVPAGSTCWSGTGAVSRLDRGTQARILDGLPSVYNATTLDVTGPHDIGFRDGVGIISIGFGTAPALRAGLGPAATGLAALHTFTVGGEVRRVLDLVPLELANPDGQDANTNPYGLLAEPARLLVTDAGGNFIASFESQRSGTVAAVLPPLPNPPGTVPPIPVSQAVPTEIERGPDGALYASQLGGFPFATGVTSIVRIVPGSAPQPFRTGFTAVTDFDFAPDGTLYVLQYASGFSPPPGGPGFLPNTGSVVRVATDGTRTTLTTGLDRPTGLVVGPDGAVYVANKGVTAGGGEVLRIVP